MFNKLPIEIQEEILVNNPNYMTLRKNMDKNIFYNIYCNQDITMNEFLNYYNNDMTCILYLTSIDDDLQEFTVIVLDKENISQYLLFIEDIDIDEYVINIIMTKFTLNTIKKYLSNLKYTNVYFDIITTYNILNLRNCQTINENYAKTQTLKIFNNMTPEINVDNLYSFYDACKKALYLKSNDDLMNQENIIIDLEENDLINIVFNTQGDLINDIEDIEILLEKYNLKENLLELIYLL